MLSIRIGIRSPEGSIGLRVNLIDGSNFRRLPLSHRLARDLHSWQWSGLAKAMGEALSAVSLGSLIGNLGDPLIRFPILFFGSR
jgi:hypothetical protein